MRDHVRPVHCSRQATYGLHRPTREFPNHFLVATYTPNSGDKLKVRHLVSLSCCEIDCGAGSEYGVQERMEHRFRKVSSRAGQQEAGDLGRRLQLRTDRQGYQTCEA